MGGDLNIINKKGETPLALGTFKILKHLNLVSGIATSECNNTYFNNNRLFEKNENKYNNHDFAQFKFNKLSLNSNNR